MMGVFMTIKDLDFVYEIQDLRLVLRKKDIKIGVVESVELDNHIIKILCDDNSYSERVRDIINLYISNILPKITISTKKTIITFSSIFFSNIFIGYLPTDIFYHTKLYM